MDTFSPDSPYALRRMSFVCTIFYICLFSLTAAQWMPKRREQLWRDRLWLYYLAALPPIFGVVRCVLLHKRPLPLQLIDVFNSLVYGPMTLVILGFTEAASRKREQRLYYILGAAVPAMIMLAEVGWSAHGYIVCGSDIDCRATQETGQLYFYLAWAIVDCVITAGFVTLLYKSLATMHRAQWHVIALGSRCAAILALAIVGLVRRTRLVREAQVDIAMGLSICFLVVRAFKSLVSTTSGKTHLYPSRRGEHSAGRTKRSAGRDSPEPSSSSQQHINVVDYREGSDEVDGDIELDTIYARAGMKSGLSR